MELKKTGAEFNTFSDFFEDLTGIENPDYLHNDFIKMLTRELIDRFRQIDISVENPRLINEVEYRIYRKEYENALSYTNHLKKSFNAMRNDLNAILHISDMQYDLEGDEFVEPYFITWDTSFFEVRNKFRKFQELSYWYLMPPLKFSDTISVIDMKINTEALNYNIISMAEDNFNQSSDSISFIDLLNSIIDDKKISQWKLGCKFATLRKKLQSEIQLSEIQTQNKTNPPIDELLLLIQDHYQSKSKKNNFASLTSLFQNNLFADRICNLIEHNLDDFQENSSLKSNIITEIDSLIEENNKM